MTTTGGRKVAPDPGRDTRPPFQLGLRDFPLRLQAPSALIARQHEIDVLSSGVARSAADRSEAIFIAGPAGIGKTALIGELRPIVTSASGWFAAGTFIQGSLDDGSNALVQAMRDLGRLLLAKPEAELARYREQLRAALADKSDMTEMISALFPEFGLLLGVEPAMPGGDPLEVRNRALQAALDVLRITAAAHSPVVMVLDDLQWAPAISLEFVDRLLTGGDVPGLLLICAYRAEDINPGDPLAPMLTRWAELGVPTRTLTLKGFGPTELSHLLAEMLRLDPADATRLAEAIGPRTMGNPRRTVELLNALRTDGMLWLSDSGWNWDAEAIRRHAGTDDGEDLAARIDRLPDPTVAVLEVLACLGEQTRLGSLETAAQVSAEDLLVRIGPALEDGLLILTRAGGENGEAVSFRHDRVRQAVTARLDPAARPDLHLQIGRRLADRPDEPVTAATQYLAALPRISDPAERRQVVELLHSAGSATRLVNPAMTDRFITVALELLAGLTSIPGDDALAMDLEIERHAALYSLGQLTALPGIYRSIERLSRDPLDLVDSASVQIFSLIRLGRPADAVTLGLDLLRRLGTAVPTAAQLADEIDRGIGELDRWLEDDDLAGDLARPDASDPRVIATAQIIRRAAAAAFFSDQQMMAWLVMESCRLWQKFGPCRELVSALSLTGGVLIGLWEDYRTGYRTMKRVLEVSADRGYEPETSHARFLFSASSTPWFEPLEATLAESQRACQGLLRNGDVQTAIFAAHTALYPLLDCAATLDDFLPVVESALALAIRAGDQTTVAGILPSRQLVRALRGQTSPAQSLCDESFDEEEHLASLGANSTAAFVFHLGRGLIAALFGDEPELSHQSAAAMSYVSQAGGTHGQVHAYLLQAVASANAARTADSTERDAAIEQLDGCCEWFAARAADSLQNFGHLVAFVDAERAWALNDFPSAMESFEAAMLATSDRRRWQKALITERAAAFQLARGHQDTARTLTTTARDIYASWGATAKVEQMHRKYPYLRPTAD